MKKYLYLIILLFLVTSCDVEEGPFITDYNSYINPDKKVLIEDFTGHLCPNCPDAAREMEAIHEIYGDQIIGMAIHVTKAFARPYPLSQFPKFQYDFRTQWGDQWDNIYGISDLGLPRGMVNRSLYPDAHQMSKDEWAEAVALELKKDIDFKIYITSTENNISITTEVINDRNNKYNIVVCLTESNIVNWQKDGTSDVSDYVHNHVLKTVLADELLSNNTSLFTGEMIVKNYNYNIEDLEEININYSLNNTSELGNGEAGNWNIENLSVIAYIYNNITHEIVQVEEAHLN